MSLETIARKMRDDASAEASEILGTAGVERESALAEARKRLEEEFSRELERVDRSTKELEGRLRFHAEREAGRRIESQRRILLDRAISRAVDRLANLPDAEYRILIKTLLAGCLMQGDIEVRISRADEGRITPDLLAEVSGGGRSFMLSEERHSGTGGVIMTSGGISYNATFSMLAALERENLIMALSSSLSENGG